MAESLNALLVIFSTILNHVSSDAAICPYLPRSLSSTMVGYDRNKELIWILGGYPGYSLISFDVNNSSNPIKDYGESALTTHIYVDGPSYIQKDNILYYFVYNKFYAFNLSTFQDVTNFTQPRTPIYNVYSCCISMIDNYLIVVGGRDNDVVRKMQIYNLESESWFVGIDLNQGRAYQTCNINSNNYLYQIGGYDYDEYDSDDKGALDSIERIYVGNITNNIYKETFWMSLNISLSQPKYHLNSVIFNDIIYIIGGLDVNAKIIKEIDIFDTINEQIIKSNAKLITAIYQSSIIVVNQLQRIYIFGGTNDHVTTDLIQFYDIFNDSIGCDVIIHENNVIFQNPILVALYLAVPTSLLIIFYIFCNREKWSQNCVRWSIKILLIIILILIIIIIGGTAENPNYWNIEKNNNKNSTYGIISLFIIGYTMGILYGLYLVCKGTRCGQYEMPSKNGKKNKNYVYHQNKYFNVFVDKNKKKQEIQQEIQLEINKNKNNQTEMKACAPEILMETEEMEEVYHNYFIGQMLFVTVNKILKVDAEIIKIEKNWITVKYDTFKYKTGKNTEMLHAIDHNHRIQNNDYYNYNDNNIENNAPEEYNNDLDEDVIKKTDTQISVDYNEDECIVCMDNKREYVCTPCGHYCLCSNCKNKINDKCPICQTKCGVMKIFK